MKIDLDKKEESLAYLNKSREEMKSHADKRDRDIRNIERRLKERDEEIKRLREVVEEKEQEKLGLQEKMKKIEADKRSLRADTDA